MRRKLFAAALSLSMIVALAPGLAASDASGETVGLLVTDEGIQEVTEAQAEALQATEQAQSSQCGGLAPVETYCHAGDLERQAFALLVLCEAGDRYTGTIEVRLHQEGEDFQWKCTVVNGQFQGNERIGPTPDAGETFMHETYSYVPQDADALGEAGSPIWGLFDGDPDGTPGGVGEWGGYVETW